MTGGKFKLKKGYRETVEAAREEAAKFGLRVSYTLVGRHPKLLISDGMREVVTPFSSTPRVNMQAEFARRKVRGVARWFAAQGIEARSATTEGRGPEDESPVPKECAQNLVVSRLNRSEP